MAKQVKMMMLDSCPHCARAIKMVDALKSKHPEYQPVEIEMIEEEKEQEKTQGYDYYYVPTYFVDGVKIHEGVPSFDAIETVLKAAVS